MRLTVCLLTVFSLRPDYAEYATSHQYSGRDIEIYDRDNGSVQQASAVALTYDYVCDAEMSILVHWILNSENALGLHSLNVTALLDYYEYSLLDGSITDKSVSTSVILEIGADDNNSQETAYRVEEGTYDMLFLGGYDQVDYYVINADNDCVIDVEASARGNDATTFNPSIVDDQGGERAHSGKSASCLSWWKMGQSDKY